MIMDVFLVFPGKNLNHSKFYDDTFKIQLGVNWLFETTRIVYSSVTYTDW